MPTHDIVLVPFWIKDVLDHKKLSCQVLLDYQQVSKLFSQDEIINFMALQDSKLLGIPGHVLGSNVFNLRAAWLATGMSDEEFFVKESAARLSASSFLADMVGRFRQGQFGAQDQPRSFDIIDMRQGSVAVVIYPEVFAATGRVEESQQFILVQMIMRVLYSYHSGHQHMVAKLPIAKQYLMFLNQGYGG